MPRGKSWTSIPSDAEGLVKWFPDVDWSQQGVKPRNSNSLVKCRLVQNNDATTLTASLLVTYEAGSFGKVVDDYAAATDQPAGLVDEYIGSGGVPVGSWFWIVQEGPCTAHALGTVTADTIVACAAGGKIDNASSPPTDNDVGRAMAGIASTTGRVWLNLLYS
jgi:hypothetical protein